jgi:DNA-binding MarR family transcriptional regulator
MRSTYSIEDVLGTRSRVAVLRVLHGVTVPLNASQIAARTGLTRPAVASVLRDLAAMGIVQNSPAGRATIHWLRRDNIYVECLIDPLFQAESRIPDGLIDDLRQAFQAAAVSVVLIGSYARGDQSPESDVDVVLVAEDASAKAALESIAADHAVRFWYRFGAPLSYMTYTRHEAARLHLDSPQLAASIRHDGIVVTGSSPWEWTEDGEK